MAARFGTVLREYRLRAGLTQEGLADRSGVSRHAISMLESGKRHPRMTTVAHIATGLDLDSAGRRLLVAAARTAITTPSAPGSAPRHDATRTWPADITDTRSARFRTAEDRELARNLAWGTTLTPDTVDTFLAQTELLRTLDRRMGPAASMAQTRAHVAALDRSLSFSMLPGTRESVAQALACAATLAASQALDLGAAEDAWRLCELARRAALESKHPRYVADVMARQANVLSARPDLAVQLVQAAHHTVGRKASPRQLAWLHAAAAKTLAYAGRRDACLRALDRAAALLPPGEDCRDPDMPSIYFNDNVLARWRGRALVHLGEAAALDELYDALAENDATFIRATAGLRCDLARAHLARGERDEAIDHLRHARRLADNIGAARHLSQVEQLITTVRGR
ncbi:helix-turn-helix domain-containing protein [Kitasatospora sp. GAS1066B]|uniref:helix-turn-helix domain-containing protein n=1 Tax=Kitasatospora sp. GAS1066B TaxID=3156271 RepID=UPI0035165BB8